MAHDRGVREEPRDVALVERGDARGIESGERGSEPLALAEDREPRQPALEPLEAQLLQDPHVVDDGASPLVVVIAAVLLGRRTPRTPPDTVISTNESVGHDGVTPRATPAPAAHG